MGLFRKKGTWRTVRADYASRPRNEWTDDEEAHWWATCSEAEYWAEWEAWSRETVPHPRVHAIRRSCLDMALEAARETDGQAVARAAQEGRLARSDGGAPGAEFACLLRIQDGVITEPVLLPGTVSGDEHAIFDLWMMPHDPEVRGSLHSHPDEHPYPSDDDLDLFGHQGEIHLILCRPYGPDDWRAYDHTGQPIALEVA